MVMPCCNSLTIDEGLRRHAGEAFAQFRHQRRHRLSVFGVDDKLAVGEVGVLRADVVIETRRALTDERGVVRDFGAAGQRALDAAHGRRGGFDARVRAASRRRSQTGCARRKGKNCCGTVLKHQHARRHRGQAERDRQRLARA